MEDTSMIALTPASTDDSRVASAASETETQVCVHFREAQVPSDFSGDECFASYSVAGSNFLTHPAGDEFLNGFQEVDPAIRRDPSYAQRVVRSDPLVDMSMSS